MKFNINTLLNILVIGGIIYLIIKFKNLQETAKLGLMEAGRNTTDTPEPTINNIIPTVDNTTERSKPLNFSFMLVPGATGNEVTALQMMLQYYFPTQVITGNMDDATFANMKSIVSGTYAGDINLHTFTYSFFSTMFPEAYRSIIEKFPTT